MGGDVQVLSADNILPIGKKTEFLDKLGDTWAKGGVTIQAFPLPPCWQTENKEPQKQITSRYIVSSLAIATCWLTV